MNTTACLEYLDRIHFPALTNLASLEPSSQTLQKLHEAHLLAVPFENLSIHYGQPIILQEEALFNKIVNRRRGGFCYELNGLFAWLLRQLGFRVSLLSAGVANDSGGFSPEFDHMILLIHQVSGSDWLADVGFGDSFLHPLRFEADLAQEDANGRMYRLHRAPAQNDEKPEYWLMQQLNDGKWESQCRFTLQPYLLSDFEKRCIYQQISPESHFTQRRICSLATTTGRNSLSDLRLITTILGNREERVLQSEEEYLETLARLFGVVV